MNSRFRSLNVGTVKKLWSFRCVGNIFSGLLFILEPFRDFITFTWIIFEIINIVKCVRFLFADQNSLNLLTDCNCQLTSPTLNYYFHHFITQTLNNKLNPCFISNLLEVKVKLLGFFLQLMELKYSRSLFHFHVSSWINIPSKWGLF